MGNADVLAIDDDHGPGAHQETTGTTILDQRERTRQFDVQLRAQQHRQRDLGRARQPGETLHRQRGSERPELGNRGDIEVLPRF